MVRLRRDLHEAGLSGRLHLGGTGLHTPPPASEDPESPGSSPLFPGTSTTPGAEEVAFPPDALLRPAVAGTRAGGRLVELVGQPSSGRTALAYRLAAGATARGQLAAWVDLPDALDPRFLRRAGVDLSRVLWVRPPRLLAALRAAELVLKTGFAVVAVDLSGGGRRELGKLGPPVWTRLLRAVRETRATAVLLTPERLAGSFATQALYTRRQRAHFDRGLFEGLEGSVTVLRDRAVPHRQDRTPTPLKLVRAS